jgi:hypothetical protein
MDTEIIQTRDAQKHVAIAWELIGGGNKSRNSFHDARHKQTKSPFFAEVHDLPAVAELFRLD